MKKVYTDGYWELVRQHLMGDTKTTATMKQMTKKGPTFLVGIEFNIPLYNAMRQTYICNEVKETTHGSYLDHKEYIISFNWIPTSYSVPEKIEMLLFIPNHGDTSLLTISEITNKGNKFELVKKTWKKEKLNTLNSLKEIFVLTAEKL